MGTTVDKLEKLIETKADIKAALIEKGQSVAESDPFDVYGDKIRNIKTGGITPSGTIYITKNDTYNVSRYEDALVNVKPNVYETTLKQNNKRYTPTAGYDGFSAVTVDVPDPELYTLTARQNHETYSPPNGYDGFDEVTVDVPDPILEPRRIEKNGVYYASDEGTNGWDGYSYVEVEVPEPILDYRIIDENGVYYASNEGTNGWDGYSYVDVRVSKPKIQEYKETKINCASVFPDPEYDVLKEVFVDIDMPTVEAVPYPIEENGTYYADDDFGLDGVASFTVAVPEPSGHKTITSNAQNIDVKNCATVTVAVPEPSGNKRITSNGVNIDVKNYATVTVAVDTTPDYEILPGDEYSTGGRYSNKVYIVTDYYLSDSIAPGVYIGDECVYYF